MKSLALNTKLEVLSEVHVHFDSELPEYRTHGGVHAGSGGKVTSPTIMWVKALDMLMEKLRITGIDISEVVAISGCAQVNMIHIGYFKNVSMLQLS